jgi:hypothetical protein
MDDAFGPGGASTLYSERDFEKLKLSKEQGITLIRIPYWYFIKNNLFFLFNPFQKF